VRAHGSRIGHCPGAVLLILLALSTRAQSQDWTTPETAVVVGSRIRLLAPTAVQERIEGTVMEVDENSILVSTGDQRALRVPRKAVTELEIGTGRHGNAVRGVLIGAAGGAAVFAVVPPCAGLEPGQTCPTKGQFIGMGAVGGAVSGAIIGHFIKRERWVSVGLASARLNVAPTRGRSVELSVAMAW